MSIYSSGSESEMADPAGAHDQEIVRLDSWVLRRYATRARDRILFSPVLVAVGVFLLWLGLIAANWGTGLLLVAVGFLVVALGPVYYWGVGRELDRAAQTVIVGEGGIKLGLRNGVYLQVDWVDPSLNLSIWERRFQGLPEPVFILQCRFTRWTVSAYITKRGAALIEQEATRIGLRSELRLNHFGSITRIRAKSTDSR
jgi:hypothetical protein